MITVGQLNPHNMRDLVVSTGCYPANPPDVGDLIAALKAYNAAPFFGC
jgi:hypothetical protein